MQGRFWQVMALVAVVAVGWLLLRPGLAVVGAQPATGAAHAPAPSVAARSGLGAGWQQRLPMLRPSAAANPIRADARCRWQLLGGRQLAAMDPAFVALSEDESAWLARHGYPTSEQVRQALDGALSVPDVQYQMREQRNMVAAGLYGLQMTQQNDLTGARAGYNSGALNGSLYAYIKMATARVEVPESEGLSEPGKMRISTTTLVAEQLGDHQADYYRRKYAGDLSLDLWGPSIEQNAMNELRHFSRLRKLQGRDGQPPDPRPNAEAWARATAGDATIEACLR